MSDIDDLIPQLVTYEIVCRTGTPDPTPANDWLRTTESPYRARVLYLMAHFVNDSARANRLVEPLLERDDLLPDEAADLVA